MKVERIDHVHIEVKDRDVAAEWYEQVLGLTRHAGLSDWAQDPMGPLVLQGGDGSPALSLFARDCQPVIRDSTIAFRVDAVGFLDFRDSLGAVRLFTRDGRILTAGDVVDHDISWSFYFVDPDGNRIEVTTYDHEHVGRFVT